VILKIFLRNHKFYSPLLTKIHDKDNSIKSKIAIPDSNWVRQPFRHNTRCDKTNRHETAVTVMITEVTVSINCYKTYQKNAYR